MTVTVSTGAGGEAITDALTDPDLPSDVAVMVAEPSATPVTIPVEPTGATPVLLEVHVALLPVRTLPLASFSVEVAWVVPPTTMLPDSMATVTVATAAGVVAVTVIVADPVLPSHVAVMVVAPTPVAVTSPSWPMLATELLAEVQATGRPARTLPLASRSTADAVVV